MQPLYTARTYLRRWRKSDFTDIHAYSGDPETTKYFIFGTNTEADTKLLVDKTIVDYKKTPLAAYTYVVILKENEQLIGNCCILMSNKGNEAEIGWMLHKDFWQRGIGTEIAHALIKHGFEKLGLRRIYAVCDSENVGSYRVMEKNGMRREGHFVKSRLSRGQYKDELYYAILKEEWEAMQ